MIAPPAAVEGGPPRVLLASMPWASLDEPSLGLAVLAACLRARGISCAVRHLNLWLLRHLRVSTCENLGELFGFNDFLFSGAIQDEPIDAGQSAALQAFIRRSYNRIDLQFRERHDVSGYEAFAMRMRNEIVPLFLDDCVTQVIEAAPTLLGLTCMYDQTIPSVALARRVKELRPDILIVMGGYALEPPVGLEVLKAFPWIDAVVAGEGEDRIEALALASVDRSRLAAIPGLHYRAEDGSIHTTPRGPRVLIEASPTPDYDDWFADVARMEAENEIVIPTPILALESSRGCWWGQTQHCVFCGIDDDTMKYRAKSAERVMHDLTTVSKRYNVRNFRFSDYILPQPYYQTLLPMLAASEERYGIHYEMKSNIRPEHADILAAAGAYAIQPGIESFNASILRKMSKGVSGIQNVLTVKLLHERGIACLYNVLYGFPSDELRDYEELCATIPLLYHLPSPYNLVGVLMTRYAPMQVAPERFGIHAPLRADPNYRMIFSQTFLERTGFNLENYCYIFEQPWEYAAELRPLYDLIVYQVTHWANMHATGATARLSYEMANGQVHFFDSRYDRAGRALSFGADHALVYGVIAERIRSSEQIAADLEGALPLARVEEVLGELAAERLVMHEERKWLGLALTLAAYERLEELERELRATEAEVPEPVYA